MQTNHEKLMALTELMPMKQICIDEVVEDTYIGVQGPVTQKVVVGEIPYLQRYYVGQLRCGRDVWLHRFLRNDAERHLHSHPFNFTTIMLCGGYTEQYLDEHGKQWRITTPCAGGPQMTVAERIVKLASHGIQAARPSVQQVLKELTEYRTIDVFDWHRIASVEPETWTCMIVDEGRLPMWFFRDDDGGLRSVKSSDRDWWKNYNVRPLGECIGDNSK